MATETKKRKIIEDPNDADCGQSSGNCNEEIANTSTILSLNDDCLREICDYLNLTDLCAFSDVCGRFKQNGQAKFRSLKMKSVDRDLWTKLPDVTKYSLLRNFGQSITSLVAVALKRNNEYLVLMIIRYCGEALKALILHRFRLNAYLGERLLSLISCLEKFGIVECHCQPSFCERLPFHSPNLLELQFKFEYYSQYSNVFVHGGLPQTFPKLQTLSFVDLEIKDLKRFLIKNQQVRTIHLESMNGNEEHFALIAEHLPTIENVAMVVSKRWNMENHSNLRKFSALKSLLLKSHRYTNVENILRKMASEKVPIENLQLMKCPCNQDLLAQIQNFEKLKTLRLIDIDDISLKNVVAICKNLDELIELQYRSAGVCTSLELLALIRSAKKLQKLHFENKNRKMGIDADVFMKIVDTVRTRRNEHNRLEIVLMGELHTIDVTKEMMYANKQTLTIEIKNVWEEIDFGFSTNDPLEIDINFDLDPYHPFTSRTRRRRWAPVLPRP